MRSLPSIIKASQYDGIHGQSVNPSELPRMRPSNAANPVQNIRDAKDQHQAIVKEALQKAKDIVEATQTYSLNQLKESAMRMNEECAQMKIRSYEDGYRQGLAEGQNEGREIGYEDGYQQGLKKAREEVETQNKATSEAAKEEISRILESIEAQKTEILNRFEGDLEGLSIAIAQKILRRELSTDENTLKTIVESVLEPYRNQAWVKINVSPSNAELIMKADQTIIENLQKVSNNVKIVPSPELKDGDCIIDLPDRLINAGVDEQLGQIKTALSV